MSLFPITHKDLVICAYRWVLKNGSCGMALRELVSITGEIPDVIGFGMGGHSVLIECKTSKSDFIADRLKPFRTRPENGMGLYRLFCVPTGLIKIEDLPNKWGLIYVGQDHKTKAFINSTKYLDMAHERNLKAEHGLMYSALRRLHGHGHLESIYNFVEYKEQPELI